jgi:hypothetical protein
MKVHPTPVFSMNDEMAIDMLKVTEGEPLSQRKSVLPTKFIIRKSAREEIDKYSLTTFSIFYKPGGIFFHRVCRTNYTDTLRPQKNHPV